MKLTSQILRKVGAISSVAVIAALGIQSPAFATVTTACDSGKVCMWEDADKGGDRYIHHSPSVSTEVNIDGWNGDNEISSIWNNTTCGIRVYDNDTYGGSSIWVSAGTYLPNLTDNGFNDKAESFRIFC